MPKKKTGFTLLEVVVSIVLFTILSCFIMAIVPPLIVKFRASAFKEQTIYLAKGKLEEYLYTAPAETTPPDSGILRFAAPYNNFWYRVTLASYGSNTNTNLVTVNVWGPTADGNRTNINRVNLVGLAKVATQTETTYTFALPEDISSPLVQIYYDPTNDQIILIESFGQYIAYNGFPQRASRYNTAGERTKIFLTGMSRDGLTTYGWAYNSKINQFLSLATQQDSYGVVLYRQTDPTSNAFLSSWSVASGGYYYGQTVTNLYNGIVSASDGTTYVVQKSPGGYGDGALIYVTDAPQTGQLITQKIVTVAFRRGNFGYQGSGSFSDFKNDIGYVPRGANNITIDKDDKVLITIRDSSRQYAIIESDKNLNHARVLFPAQTVYRDGNTNYRVTPWRVERDKFGNIYVQPNLLERQQPDGTWAAPGIYSPLLKFKEVGQGARGAAILSYTGKATNYGAVIDFTMSPDGSKLITAEAIDDNAINN